MPVNDGIERSVGTLPPLSDANIEYFFRYKPVDKDKERHDNIKLSGMLVLLENRHTSVHLFAVVALTKEIRN